MPSQTLSPAAQAFDIEAASLEFLNGRDDFLRLFPAEEPVLGAVRVKSCYGNVRIVDAKLAAGIVDKLINLYDTLLLAAVASLAERYVGGDMNHTHRPSARSMAYFFVLVKVA